MAGEAESPGPMTRARARRQQQEEEQSSPGPGREEQQEAGENMVVETVAANQGELSTRAAVALLLLIFLSSLLCVGLVWLTLPTVQQEDRDSLAMPANIEDAKQLGAVLSRYKDQYFAQVLAGFICVYIFLQTFAIPGSIFLSIISGFLFPFPLALLAVCFCSATGASFCYLLSYLAGRRLVRHYLPERAAQWSAKVDSHRSNLLSYILFLRITPFLPNWFINIVSPVIGVPLFPFWLGTFLGVAPPSFIFIQAGTTLQQLTSTMDPITVETVLLLVVFALLSLAPVLLKNFLKTKFD